jgi:hypothetical protein
MVRNYLKLKGLAIGGSANKLISAVKDDLIFIKYNKINDVRVKLIHNIHDLSMMAAAEKRKPQYLSLIPIKYIGNCPRINEKHHLSFLLLAKLR